MVGSSYIRQERTGLLIGPYERVCKVHNEWPRGPPHEWDMQLFDPAIDRMQDCLEAVMELIPSVGEVGILNVTNGPTIWTGDSLARVGATNIPGYYEFNSLTYGVAQSLALAEYLCGIMLDGEQLFDAATEFFPGRYGTWTTPSYVVEKVQDTYAKNNAPVYPFENRMAGRSQLPKPPLWHVLHAHGAVFGMGNGGVESPLYFSLSNSEGEGDTESRDGESLCFHNPHWAAIVKRECELISKGVGLGHSSFSKILISSPDAERYLNYIGTNRVPRKNGATKLSYVTTPSGRVFSEFSVCRIAKGKYYLVGNRDNVEFDQNWLQTQATKFEDIVIENISNSIEILHIAGPQSLAFLESLVPEAAQIPFLRMHTVNAFGVKCKAFHLSFTGLPGFELHVPSEHAARVYEELVTSSAAKDFGLTPFGSLAVNSLRAEVGFKLRGDLDYAHYSEAGIRAFVTNAHFLGRNENYESTKFSALFKVAVTKNGYEWSIPSDCPILNTRDDTLVGYTTSSAPGGRTGLPIAFGYLFAKNSAIHSAYDSARDDAHLAVSAYGELWNVEVLHEPIAKVMRGAPFKVNADKSTIH